MAGTNAGFNAAQFRTAIKNAMHMGLPSDTTERATFKWMPVRAFSVEDPGSKPYNWTSTPTSETLHVDVQIDCAIEFVSRPAGSRDTPVGQFDASRATLTVLDVDYPSIEGATHVAIGGNTYEIQFVGPPLGLFDVTVYQLYAEAIDES